MICENDLFTVQVALIEVNLSFTDLTPELIGCLRGGVDRVSETLEALLKVYHLLEPDSALVSLLFLNQLLENQLPQKEELLALVDGAARAVMILEKVVDAAEVVALVGLPFED